MFAAPLEFTGLFRWWLSDGAPGFVWVDAHDARLGGLVMEVDGTPVRLCCTESAYFNRNRFCQGSRHWVWSGIDGPGIARRLMAGRPG